jgi:hypothetical protein
MPNHVNSVLSINYWGDKKNYLKTILGEIGFIWKDKDRYDYQLDFDKIIPQPKGIKDKDPIVLSDSEREWNIKNWGTKWNAYQCKLCEFDKGSFRIRFQTAWNEVPKVIKKIVEKYPDINLTYVAADEGGCVAYYFDYQNEDGEITAKETTWSEENDSNYFIREALNEALSRFNLYEEFTLLDLGLEIKEVKP